MMLGACPPTTAARKPKNDETLAETPQVLESYLHNPKVAGSTPATITIDMTGVRSNADPFTFVIWQPPEQYTPKRTSRVVRKA